ncbi:MAG: hydroxymethylglutaryl-CoA reductase, degradative [Lactobacillaceae bacterium]|jgi:hydroxymethylglutaryl-CoA reductase|nr:hydroxymethylglutaryl-CoA reductase, degradative [Lactobacillaceae bacterium]
MTKFRDKTYEERLSEIAGQNKELMSTYLKYVNSELSNITENYISSFPVPIGILRELKVNNKTYIVPIATEEPSVVAAANKGAKMLGNVTVTHEVPTYKLVQILSTDKNIIDFTKNYEQEIIDVANNSFPSIVQRGGGALFVQTREINDQYFSIHIQVDTKDAMGANIVNTMGEAVANFYKENKIDVVTSIVSNLNLGAVFKASTQIKLDLDVLKKIKELADFGQLDIYRASTENKGFLNGAAGVVLATGNDWRSFEAGAHAYASLNGQYKSFTTYQIDLKNNQLVLSAEIPVSLGTVGGSIQSHPIALANLKLLKVQSADELSSIVIATGLAQTFAAMYALVTTGIQSGHMKMQKRLN